jgi:DNA polymerase-3 subunit epsilon
MLEVIIDTETTGLSVAENHKIIEIGCIELNNQIPTNKIFHEYINPKRSISEEAYKVHGYSEKFLSGKKIFSEIADSFLNFIKDKKLIIHNAPFDLAFLNYELKLINHKGIDKKNVVDTLEMARAKFPGAQNSLDALCKRFNIDNSKREKHSALLDCHLLKEVYVNLLDQKEPKLNLETSGILGKRFNFESNRNKNLPGKIVKINDNELKLHKDYLKTQLQKNNYN